MDDTDQRGQLGLLQDTPLHNYVRPNAGGPFADATWSPGKPGEIQTGYDIKQTFRPAPDEPLEEYERYRDNVSIILSKQEEHLVVGDEGPIVGQQPSFPAHQSAMSLITSDARIHPELTAKPVHSPAPFEFLRAYGQQIEHYFSGKHSSAAGILENREAQIAMLGGLTATPELRSTFRIAPPFADVAQVNESVPFVIQQNPYIEAEQYDSARGFRIG